MRVNPRVRRIEMGQEKWSRKKRRECGLGWK